MKIAVIGSGISGLSATHILSKKHKVDLYEKEDHFGGHSYTVKIPNGKENSYTSVDIGFIVFNKITYPNLINLFDSLKVPYEKSNMSFSVSVKNSQIEYSGTNISGLFANRLNLFNIKHLIMIKEIISFYNEAEKIDKNTLESETLGSFLKSKNLSKYFIDYHLIPMAAAIWSVSTELAKEIPLIFFINFFKNHGLFKLKNRPQWYTVSGRSKIYVNKILDSISGQYFKNYPIKKIIRNKNSVRLNFTISNDYLDYDGVVLATHADEALKLLERPTKDEKEILSNFRYKKNIAYLHFDSNLMPKRKRAWSSWNSILDKNDLNKNCVTYWLNNLQNLKITNNIFLTINPFTTIDEKKIFKIVDFTHPLYEKKTIKYQNKLINLQGVNNTWFCGSYFGYGFHEDGIKSAKKITEKL